MKENVIQNKKFCFFALRVIKLIINTARLKRKEYILGKQLMRSGTSYLEAMFRRRLEQAESKLDLFHKLGNCSKKEVHERQNIGLNFYNQSRISGINNKYESCFFRM